MDFGPGDAGPNFENFRHTSILGVQSVRGLGRQALPAFAALLEGGSYPIWVWTNRREVSKIIPQVCGMAKAQASTFGVEDGSVSIEIFCRGLVSGFGFRMDM